LRDLGVEIRISDFQTDTPAELDEALKGADVVISTCYYTAIPDQIRLVDSAKRVGAKRFIPCDWGTSSPRGIMDLHDTVNVIEHSLSRLTLIGKTEIQDPRLYQGAASSVHHYRRRVLVPSDPPVQVGLNVVGRFPGPYVLWGGREQIGSN
jgi:hypothetical protein